MMRNLELDFEAPVVPMWKHSLATQFPPRLDCTLAPRYPKQNAWGIFVVVLTHQCLRRKDQRAMTMAVLSTRIGWATLIIMDWEESGLIQACLLQS